MKIYHLSSCSTCKRIIHELGITTGNCEFFDVKKEQISEVELDEWAVKAGSYEALFSRKSMKYRPMGLHEKTLTEQDYKKLILQEYTFLKRPIILLKDQIFIGNQQKTIDDVKKIGLG